MLNGLFIHAYLHSAKPPVGFVPSSSKHGRRAFPLTPLPGFSERCICGRVAGRWSSQTPWNEQEYCLTFTKDIYRAYLRKLRLMAKQSPSVNEWLFHTIRNYQYALRQIQKQVERRPST